MCDVWLCLSLLANFKKKTKKKHNADVNKGEQSLLLPNLRKCVPLKAPSVSHCKRRRGRTIRNKSSVHLNLAIILKIKWKLALESVDCGRVAGLWCKTSIEGKDFPKQDEWAVSSSSLTNEGWSVASVLWRSLGVLISHNLWPLDLLNHKGDYKWPASGVSAILLPFSCTQTSPCCPTATALCSGYAFISDWKI